MRLQIVEHSLRKLLGRRAAAHVWRADLAVSDHAVHASGNLVCVVVETEVTEHHRGTEDHGRWVGLVRAHNVHSGVTAAGLVEGVLAADVGTRNDAWATDQRGANVGHNVTVQVGRHHDVKLVRAADQLHRRIVDDHVIGLDAGALVLLGDATERVEEQTITELHNVGLVDAGDLLAVVLEGEVERETGDALGLVARHDLERLDNAGRGAVLEATVLTLSVFTDDRKVNVRVARLQTLERATEHHRGKNIKLLTHRDIPAVVRASTRGRHERTLQTHLRAAQTVHGLLELRVAALHLARQVKLLPLDRHVQTVKDLLDRVRDLLTDTVTGNQRRGINTTVFGRALRTSVIITYLGQTRRLCHQRRHRARHLA